MMPPDLQQVIDNELALLTPEVRHHPTKVGALLDPNFAEIGASGRWWTRESTLSALASEPPAHDAGVTTTEMRGAELSPDLILLTYVSNAAHRRVRRSSLWRRSEGSWLLLFHQGTPSDVPRVAKASREIAAGTGRIFELIADPALQLRWDGNDNLAAAATGQRIRNVGQVFTMTLTGDGAVRENHVVEFDEGRRIAWRPAEPGQPPPGHLWRWELDPIDVSRTLVTHIYDWSELSDEKRFARARATTAAKLQASLDRLAALAEGRDPSAPA